MDHLNYQWDLKGKSFVESKSITHWALLDFVENECQLQREAFVQRLIYSSKNLGMQLAQPLVRRVINITDLATANNVERLLQDVMKESNKTTKGKMQLLICAMAKRVAGYKNFKWVSETKIGVITQCVMSQKANKGEEDYLAYVCLKINAKLGGKNFELSRKLLHFGDGGQVMFIGADLNHPGQTKEECPSIAAVVGTVNWPAATRYAARLSAQKGFRERIENFGEMCKHLITAYAQMNMVKPGRIIVFRDGVSDAEFEMVLKEELLDLQNTISTGDYKPLITVIVAQKRHNTRLFPDEGNENCSGNGNVLPGTVVDTQIVHPQHFDFYLFSYYGFKGTNKPIRYIVLFDENGFSSDGLQELIYHMCYTCVRCTKPISLVTPVYYADLLAYRGRMYQEAAMETHTQPVSSSSSWFDQSFYNLHSDVENAMFFV